VKLIVMRNSSKEKMHQQRLS